ncbi:ABC transporter ATP-binding protein [Methylobacterium sp. ID0610]|uniref:ABC transporter ATP-binding protein n=1 Tax=Methylobacterium carpenticola TaxID=3344827 RepID=UPI00369A95EB
MTPLVEVRDLTIEACTDSGRRVEIIRGVSFDIAPGEIVALIGESGSGKTTIALNLMGYTRPGCRVTGGSVQVAGHDMIALPERRRAAIRGSEVSYVPQSAAAAFNPAHRIMDQVVEVARIHRTMPVAQAREKALALFRALALPNPETIGERYPHQVSGGQLQRLSATMALIGDPKLVIFDEPTTALDVTTQVEVLRAFKAVMRERKVSGVYVSHDLAVVAQIADRIIVLRNGVVQEDAPTPDILERPQHPYTRQLLAAFRPSTAPRVAAEAEPTSPEPLLVVRDIVAGYGGLDKTGVPRLRVLDKVSIDLAPGRNLGIVGESGCGKSTLARVIAGIMPAARGEIRFEGRALAPDLRGRSREELRAIQIVFQCADTALNPAKSIEEILGRPLTFYHGMGGRERDARISELLEIVRLPRALRHRRPGELSGGQKQRVNLARALAANAKLILCDEITSALDTVVAAAIIDLLKELQRELSLSYLFISHDLETVRAICDEVVVMYKGEKIEQLRPEIHGGEPRHAYTKLLFSSVPQLRTGWLDGLEQDPELLKAFAQR